MSTKPQQPLPCWFAQQPKCSAASCSVAVRKGKAPPPHPDLKWTVIGEHTRINKSAAGPCAKIYHKWYHQPQLAALCQAYHKPYHQPQLAHTDSKSELARATQPRQALATTTGGTLPTARSVSTQPTQIIPHEVTLQATTLGNPSAIATEPTVNILTKAITRCNEPSWVWGSSRRHTQPSPSMLRLQH